MWTFREVSSSDSDMLLRWRNDPAIYQFLFHPYPIKNEDHQKWLNKVLADRHIFFLLGLYNAEPAGTVRFDLNHDLSTAEVGIYLASEFHGKGLSASLLVLAEEIAAKKFLNLKKIVARVLPENKASEKMFLNCGYMPTFIQLEKNLES